VTRLEDRHEISLGSPVANVPCKNAVLLTFGVLDENGSQSRRCRCRCREVGEGAGCEAGGMKGARTGVPRGLEVKTESTAIQENVVADGGASGGWGVCEVRCERVR